MLESHKTFINICIYYSPVHGVGWKIVGGGHCSGAFIHRSPEHRNPSNEDEMNNKLQTCQPQPEAAATSLPRDGLPTLRATVSVSEERESGAAQLQLRRRAGCGG